MGFIAFAYTYHYLNWFSKTSILRWHAVPRRRIPLILCVWGASLALYAWGYARGFKWLFFLSLIHVLLELPLHHRTVMEIGREMRSLRTLRT